MTVPSVCSTTFLHCFRLTIYDWHSGIVLAKEDTYKNKKAAKAC